MQVDHTAACDSDIGILPSKGTSLMKKRVTAAHMHLTFKK